MDEMSVSQLCGRLHQYKMTTPPWKEKYRKDCKDRLREKRHRVIAEYRENGFSGRSNTLSAVMLEEYENLRRQEACDDDLDFAIYEEVKKELDDEAEKIYEEYERSLTFPVDQGPNIDDQQMETASASPGALLRCAVCGVSNDYSQAAQERNDSDIVIFCGCGHLQVDRRSKVLESDLSWQQACQRLVSAINGHAGICRATAFVETVDSGINDGNQLIVFCQDCAMQLVIW